VSDSVGPEQANDALAEIQARQQQVIDTVLVPVWYWWMVAALMVALGVIVDWGHPIAIVIAALLFGVIVAGATVWMIGGRGRAQVSGELLGGSGAVRIVVVVWAVVGVSLAVGFALRAAGVHSAATIATLVAAIGVGGGGPLLMRSLRRTMLRHRAIEA
jgi:hypothetical protein